MKKIILFVLFPILSFGQVNERAQKQSYRSGGSPSSPSSSYSPSMSSRPSIGEYQQKQIERQRNNQPRGNTYIGTPGNLWYDPWYDPWWNWGWGWNRWYPYGGWNTFNRFWWYDNWGYRNPGRVYVYSDGKKDTVKAKPIHGSFGVSYNGLPEWGGWLTLGREYYFIMEYSRSFQSDVSVFYPEITKDVVMEWNDKRLPDQVNTNLFSLGAGKMLNKTFGVHLSMGFGKTKVRSKYLDELYILSNNGQYSIPDYTETISTFKVGGLMNLDKKINVKFDYDLTRQTPSLGLAFRF